MRYMFVCVCAHLFIRGVKFRPLVGSLRELHRIDGSSEDSVDAGLALELHLAKEGSHEQGVLSISFPESSVLAQSYLFIILFKI